MAKTAAAKRGGLDRVAASVVAAFALGVALVRRPPRDEPDPSGRTSGPSEADSAARTGGWRAKVERVPVLRGVLRVHQRYGELSGNNLAAAVAFQTFVSLFPLLLVLVAVVGFVSANSDVDVAGRIIANLGLTGDSADTIGNAVNTAEDSRRVAAPIGVIGLLWSGLGLVNAFQFAFNQAWQVEDRGIKDKAVGLLWLGGAVLLFVGASAVTTVINFLPGFAAPLGIALGLAVNFALWLWTFKVLPNRDVPWRNLVAGALVGAIGMEVLKVVGAIYVPRAVASSSELYGSLGVVFAVLVWLLFFSRLMLYAAITNVVRWERTVGTVETTIEVPGGPEVQPTDDVTRGGRIQREDAAA